GEASPLEMAAYQRSHVLLVLSTPKMGGGAEFLSWYKEAYREAVISLPGVLSLQLYAQNRIGITMGQNPRLPFDYLGFAHLSVDVAAEAEPVIEEIALLHKRQEAAEIPATWLYYPASERVGREAKVSPSVLTVAFANPVPGLEAQFREWYATRHIRHALSVT